MQTCFTPCQNPLGCAPPTPTYDQFVRWGQTGSGQALSSPSFANQSAAIAAATVAGSAAVGAGIIAIGATIANAHDRGSALAAALFPMAALDTMAPFIVALVLDGASYTPLVGTLAATSIAGAVAIVVAAIAILAVQGIAVANIDQLPGKLAALVTQSRQPIDPKTMIDTTDGASTLFALYVAATLPIPRTDESCDTSEVGLDYREVENGFIKYWPLGTDAAKYIHIRSCLNPAPVRSALDTDPVFRVTNSTTGAVTQSPTITFADTQPEQASRRVSVATGSC